MSDSQISAVRVIETRDDIEDAMQAIREGRLMDALAYLNTAKDSVDEVLTDIKVEDW